MIKLFAIFFISCVLSACVSPKVMLQSSASMVKVGKSDPSNNYKEIGHISATDGGGCGGLGFKGTHENAINILKNKAANKGGDYVQIFTITQPHFSPGCFSNEYTIQATLFKKISDEPISVSVVNNDEKPYKKLKILKELLDNGVLTQSEFDEEKFKILNKN